MNRDELLAAVVAERLDCRWFAAPARTAEDIHVGRDDEMTTARRRKALLVGDEPGGRWIQRHGVQVWEVVA